MKFIKYEYFSLSLISFISGLLITRMGFAAGIVPFVLNFLWFTYHMAIVAGFVLLGFLVWRFIAVLCMGFGFATGNVVYKGNNTVFIDQIESRTSIPSSLQLRYNGELQPGKRVRFSCFFYGNRGKILKVYSQKDTSPSFIDRIRNYLKSKIQLSKQSEFLYAILLGDRSHMINQEIFKTNGIIHVFALSGLHISILMFYVRLFMRYFLSLSFFLSYSLNPVILSTLIALFLSLIYTLVSFSSASALRSLVMCSIAFLIPQIDPKKSLLVTVFILLLFNPNYVFDQSFQMSCLATFSIFSQFDNLIQQQLYINSVMIPFTQVFSPLSIVMNIVVVPLVAVILLCSFIMIHSASTIKILDILIEFLMSIMRIRLPYISITMSPPAKICYCGLITIAVYLNRMWIVSLGFLFILFQNIYYLI